MLRKVIRSGENASFVRSPQDHPEGSSSVPNYSISSSTKETVSPTTPSPTSQHQPTTGCSDHPPTAESSADPTSSCVLPLASSLDQRVNRIEDRLSHMEGKLNLLLEAILPLSSMSQQQTPGSSNKVSSAAPPPTSSIINGRMEERSEEAPPITHELSAGSLLSGESSMPFFNRQPPLAGGGNEEMQKRYSSSNTARRKLRKELYATGIAGVMEIPEETNTSPPPSSPIRTANSSPFNVEMQQRQATAEGDSVSLADHQNNPDISQSEKSNTNGSDTNGSKPRVWGIIPQLSSTQRAWNYNHPLVTLVDIFFVVSCVITTYIVLLHISPQAHQRRKTAAAEAILALLTCELGTGLWMFVFSRTRSSVGFQTIDDIQIILQRYKQFWFWYDLVYTIPVEFLFVGWANPIYFVVNLRHLLRFPRLIGLMSNSNSPLRNHRPWFILTALLGVILIVIIFFSSLFLALHGSDHDKDPNTPPLEFIDALYFVVASMTTTGYGDIVLQSETGRIYAVLVMVVGLILTTSLTATGASVLFHQDVLQQDFEEKKRMMFGMLNYYDIDIDTCNEVMLHFPVILHQLRKERFVSMCSNLPYYLHGLLEAKILGKMLLATPLFRVLQSQQKRKDQSLLRIFSSPLLLEAAFGNSREEESSTPGGDNANTPSYLSDKDCLAELVQSLESRIIEGGAYLFRQGDAGEEMYFIMKGRLDIVAEIEESDEELVLGTFQQGSWLCEQNLLREECVHVVSAWAVERSEVFVLAKEHFDNVAAKSKKIQSQKEQLLRRGWNKSSATEDVTTTTTRQKLKKNNFSKLEKLIRYVLEDIRTSHHAPPHSPRQHFERGGQPSGSSFGHAAQKQMSFRF